jgi:hypothetical protein
VFGPEDASIDAAEEQVRALLVKLAHSLRTDEWRGQYEEEEELRAPEWAIGGGGEVSITEMEE